jgi:hypothetical protein
MNFYMLGNLLADIVSLRKNRNFKCSNCVGFAAYY